MTPEQNGTNQQNANKGTSGTNTQYDKNQGNRGAQMDPKQGGKNSGKGGGNKGGGKR
jgi:hypothetical protein